MKKIIFCFIASLCMISCHQSSNNTDSIHQMTPQEYFDNKIKKSIIYNEEGHKLIFYETGIRGWRNYAFSIEHSMECEKCFAAFD